MKTKTVKLDKILKTILKRILQLILILILIYNLIYNLFNLFNINSFFGKRLFIMSNNTMYPKLDKNDVIMITKTSKLKQDDIILCFQNGNYKVRRIINVKENDRMSSYVLKGDNTYYAEEILKSDIIGKTILTIPKAGWLLILIRSKILTIAIIVLAIMLYRHKKHLQIKREKRRKKHSKIDVPL